jgi:Domain of unknown function (DUF4406)
MKLYLAGPMQGIPHFNFPLFNDMAKRLRAAGHEVFNPAERDIERHGGVDISKGNLTGSLQQSQSEHKFSLRDALADDLTFICKEAEGIVLLPGWEHSNGAFAEWATARALSKATSMIFFYVLKHGDDYVLTTTAEDRQNHPEVA